MIKLDAKYFQKSLKAVLLLAGAQNQTPKHFQNVYFSQHGDAEMALTVTNGHVAARCYLKATFEKGFEPFALSTEASGVLANFKGIDILHIQVEKSINFTFEAKKNIYDVWMAENEMHISFFEELEKLLAVQPLKADSGAISSHLLENIAKTARFCGGQVLKMQVLDSARMFATFEAREIDGRDLGRVVFRAVASKNIGW